MNLHSIDLVIIAAFLLCAVAWAIYLKRFNRSVADFLVANRCAGRYMMSISGSMAGMGAIGIIGMFEMYYNSGFCANWWNMLCAPVGMLVMVSGWVNYRYRETRAMTVSQFFEMRYSKRLRIFCGILSWVAGVMTIGIIPAVTAKFFMYFCGLPQSFPLFGIQMSTFATVMFFELSIAIMFIFLGGMIVIVMTEFIQGLFADVVLLLVIGVLYFAFDWRQIVVAVSSTPANSSFINPYKTGDIEGFSMWYFIMVIWLNFYGTGASQAGQGYVAAAKNAHEAKMAGILSVWRGITKSFLIMLIPICAYTLMHCSDFISQSNVVNGTLNQIENTQIQKQAIVSIVLSKILAPGMLGLFVAIMMASAMCSDNTLLHAWGSVFIQDVVIPLRKKSLSSTQHMWLLRFSILFVAVLIFFFSLLFRQTDFIVMYLTLAISLIIAGFGSLLIGGLYWKHGSVPGAWAGVIVGGSIILGGLILQQSWCNIVPVLMKWLPQWQFLAEHSQRFPYNGMQISFFASSCGSSSYVIGSLFSWLILRKPAFNLDQLLHRGQYAIRGEHEGEVALPPTGFRSLLPSKEYTFGDKCIYFFVMAFVFSWFAFFIIVTTYHIFWGTTDTFWLGYWRFILILTVALGCGTLVWYFIGGMINLKEMLHKLRVAARNNFDDGSVSHNNSSSAEKPSKAMTAGKYEKQKDVVT